jgi:hypothetical protein
MLWPLYFGEASGFVCLQLSSQFPNQCFLPKIYHSQLVHRLCVCVLSGFHFYVSFSQVMWTGLGRVIKILACPHFHMEMDRRLKVHWSRLQCTLGSEVCVFLVWTMRLLHGGICLWFAFLRFCFVSLFYVHNVLNHSKTPAVVSRF